MMAEEKKVEMATIERGAKKYLVIHDCGYKVRERNKFVQISGYR
jgi:hypothetical protein